MASTTSNTLALHVKYTDLKWTKAEVTEEGSDAPLWSVQYKFRKPHLRFFRPGSDEPCSDATFHLMTRRIDLQLPNKATALRGKKWHSMSYEYDSPVFGGKTMTWKSKSKFKSWDYVLLNEQQLPVAKMVSVAGMSAKKIGRIEFAEDFVDSNGAKEEIVVTAITLAYYAMQQMLGGLAAA